MLVDDQRPLVLCGDSEDRIVTGGNVFSLGGQVFEQLRIGFEAVIDLDGDLGRLVLDRSRNLGKARPRS